MDLINLSDHVEKFGELTDETDCYKPTTLRQMPVKNVDNNWIAAHLIHTSLLIGLWTYSTILLSKHEENSIFENSLSNHGQKAILVRNLSAA